jgi:hypothetical protein
LRIGAGLIEGWSIFGLEKPGFWKWCVTMLYDFASPLSVATRSLWISTVFKSFRLRSITIGRWSIAITNLGESVLRENSAGQITIQRSEGSPAAGQHPKNSLCHDIGEDMMSSGPPVE